MPGARTRQVVAAIAVLAGLAGCHSAAASAAPNASGVVHEPAARADRSTPKVTAPPVNGRFDYQIGGAYPPAAGVSIVDRDWHETPAAGRYTICYVNAFQTQAEDRTWWTAKHDDLLLKKNGKLVEDPDWPGEYMLDTSTAAKRAAIASIEDAWLDSCAGKGFQGVEPDNLDSWTRSKSLLTQADNVAMATLLARHAHADGLAIAQKNTTELGSTGRTEVGFDFAIAEECQVYGECAGYTKPYGGHVIEIEYTDNPRKYYTQACSARGGTISVILRDRDVVAKGDPAYRYEAC